MKLSLTGCALSLFAIGVQACSSSTHGAILDDAGRTTAGDSGSKDGAGSSAGGRGTGTGSSGGSGTGAGSAGANGASSASAGDSSNGSSAGETSGGGDTTTGGSGVTTVGTGSVTAGTGTTGSSGTGSGASTGSTGRTTGASSTGLTGSTSSTTGRTTGGTTTAGISTGSSTGGASARDAGALPDAGADSAVAALPDASIDARPEANPCSLAPPQITLLSGSKNYLCAGGNDIITLTVPYSSAYSYRWSNGQTNYQALADQPGSYTVTITDRNRCQATSAPFVVTEVPTPSSDFTFQDGSTVNTPVTFTPVVSDATSYSWYIQTIPAGGPGSNSVPSPMSVQSTQMQPSVTYTAGGTFQALLTLTDAHGCTSSTGHDVTIVGGCPSDSITYYAIGRPQKFIVPSCATAVTIDAFGGEGGPGGSKDPTSVSAALGGRGGEATGILAVAPGDILNVFVGGNGELTPYNVSGTDTGGVYPPTPGGYNGGGAVNQNAVAFDVLPLQWSGSGGGASDVRVGGMDLVNRIIVAGGGGGGANTGLPGGNGGGLTGLPGTGSGAGGGGTQVAGGAAGTSSAAPNGALAGVLGVGGDTWRANTYGAGGGGGGYYGGGGGDYAGGGGGSSYVGGVTNGSTTPGVQKGAGKVVISW